MVASTSRRFESGVDHSQLQRRYASAPRRQLAFPEFNRQRKFQGFYRPPPLGVAGSATMP